MKLLLTLLCGSLALAAGTLSAQTIYNNLSSSPGKRAPQVGMSKTEAFARYGEPFHRTVLAGGERWLYRLKFDEVYGRALVPFYIDSDNVRLGTIDFGPDDRVKTFVWARTQSRSVE